MASEPHFDAAAKYQERARGGHLLFFFVKKIVVRESCYGNMQNSPTSRPQPEIVQNDKVYKTVVMEIWCCDDLRGCGWCAFVFVVAVGDCGFKNNNR